MVEVLIGEDPEDGGCPVQLPDVAGEGHLRVHVHVAPVAVDVRVAPPLHGV